MRKLFFIFFVFCLQLSVLQAQNRKVDSLQRILQSEKEDSNKVNTLVLLGIDFFKMTKYDSSLIYASQAKVLAEKIGYEEGLAEAYSGMATTFSSQGNYASALEYTNKALDIYRKTGNKKAIGGTLEIIGFTYTDIGDLAKALEAFFSGLTICRESGNIMGECSCLGNIGRLYYMQGNCTKALAYDSMALAASKEQGFNMAVSVIEGNIGQIYADQGDYAKAQEYYKNSLILNQKIGYKIGIATNYDNISYVYNKQGDYPQALKYEFNTLSILKDIGEENDIAQTLLAIGNIFYKQKNYFFAKKYFDSAFALSKQIGVKGLLGDIYHSLSRLDSVNGTYENEVTDYKDYILYRDSLNNEAAIKKTTQAEMNFEFTRRTDSIQAEQDKLNAVAEQESQRQKVIRNVFIGGFSLAFLASGMFFFQRRRIAIERKKLKESNAVKDKLFSIISHDLRSPLLSLSATIPLLQEEELSKETVDRLTKNLENSTYATLNMLDNLLQWSFSQIEGMKIEKEKVSLDEIIGENIILYLNPAAQKNITLQTELKSGIDVIADKNIARLVMRNLLNNAIKYTKSGGVIMVSVFKENGYAGFIVKDTGIGIPAVILQNIFTLGNKQKMRLGTNDEKSSGLGLALCQELMQKLGGRINIESKEGEGTQCRASFSFSVE
jgi:signal transduction histidine kinase